MAQREVDGIELAAAQKFGWAAHRAGADYLFVRLLDDGRAIYLMAMFGGNLRIAIGLHGALYFDDLWCFQAAQTNEAWRAALGWDGKSEPEGWYRHPQSGRRRPGGDPSKEFVRP